MEAIRKESPYIKAQTLCWRCAKACGGCSWSDSFEEIPGWQAEATYIASGHFDSYNVTACPEYVRDTRSRTADDFTSVGCIALIEKALAVARKDYLRTNNPSLKNEIVCFLADWLDDWEGALSELHRAKKELKRR